MPTGDPWALIRTPLGLPGSGRVRYGAAMALYVQGGIGAAALEVYRETAAHDARDPQAVLAARGLPPLAPGGEALTDLKHLAADHLNRLVHPGAAEVRAGLARAKGPLPLPAPVANPVVVRWLALALAAIDTPHQPLARAIAAAAPLLAWATPGGHNDRALALLMGAGAPFAAQDFCFGLELMAPGVLVPDHCRPAPGLCAPLTGPHGWRFGPGAPRLVKPAHQPVWTPPLHPQLIKVGPVPFLALFVWTHDVDQPARRVPATDGATLRDWVVA